MGISSGVRVFLEYRVHHSREALIALLRAYQTPIYNLSRQILRHDQDAEDATQEVLLEVVRGIDSVPDAPSFERWVYRVTTHTALDFRKMRSRRHSHEIRGANMERSEPLADDLREAVHQALADLDDDLRRLVVQHYFERRTLEDLASESRCSTAGIWKRIEKGKEDLRKALLATTFAGQIPLLEGVLEAAQPVAAPRDLLSDALLDQMATVGRKPVASHAGAHGLKPMRFMVPTVVFLVGAAGWVHYLRTNTDNSGVTSAAAPRAFTPLAEAARTPTLAQLAPKQERSPVPSGFPRQARRPYPFELPPPRWPETKKNIWSRIHGQRITLGLQEVPLRTVLQELARRTGVPILLDPQVEDPQVSFQISDLVAEAVLRLLLAPRQMGYEIRDDSTVWVTSLSRLTPDQDSDVRQIVEVLETLQKVKLWLADGDGMTLPEAGVEKALHDSSMLSPQQPMKAEDWLTLFRDRSRVNIVLDNQARRELGARLSEVRLSPIEEKTFGEHLEGFLKEYGLGLAVTREKVALLTTPGEAEKMNREWNARRKIHDRALLALEEPLGVLRDPSMPDLIDSLESKLRIPVLTTKAVWDATSLNLPSAETTGKDILEHLKAERGFRAALRDGRLYIIE